MDFKGLPGIRAVPSFWRKHLGSLRLKSNFPRLRSGAILFTLMTMHSPDSPLLLKRYLIHLLLLGIGLLYSCEQSRDQDGTVNPASQSQEMQPQSDFSHYPYLMVLGVAQDAGYPQAGCEKSCCQTAWETPDSHRSPTCLALVDPTTQQKWLFEATPELPQQLQRLNQEQNSGDGHLPNGIFITHAHIGHYTGLMYLGREVQGAQQVPVYTMPRMGEFLRNNGPWSQLVSLENIALQPLKHDSTLQLTPSLSVTPFLVPHRDEFSETVGYRIQSDKQAALFIPDINKWHLWDRDLAEQLKTVDLAFVDATFFKAGELPGRNMDEIPHPFVAETITLLTDLPASEKAKVRFIHFNHTNPLLRDKSAREEVTNSGFAIAEEGKRYSLGK